MNKKHLILHTIGHFCVDAVCSGIVANYYSESTKIQITTILVVYNFLAFMTEPIIGRLLDRKKSVTFYIPLAFAMLATAIFPFINIWVRIFLAGIGNSIFHVAAGIVILKESKKKATPLGIFVSSGAIGLLSGSIFGMYRIFLLFMFAVLFILASFALEYPDNTCPTASIPTAPLNLKAVILLCTSITIRSFFGFLTVTDFKKTVFSVVLTAISVFVGKFLGGILSDLLKIKNVVLFTLTTCILFFLPAVHNLFLWSLIQLLVNISMPITLYLLFMTMPDRPGFAFGLAAACLPPGAALALFMNGKNIPPLFHIIIIVINLLFLLKANNEINKKNT